MKTAIKALTAILVFCVIAPAMVRASFKPRTFAMKKWSVGKSFHSAGRADFTRNKFSPRRYRPTFSVKRRLGSKWRNVGANAKTFGVRLARASYSWNSGQKTRRFNPNLGKFGRNAFRQDSLKRKFTPTTIARAVDLW